MNQSQPREPPLAARALRLFTISAAAPVTVLLVLVMVTALHFRAEPGTDSTHVFVSVFGAVVAVFMVWPMYWNYRYKPDYWSMMTTFYGLFIALFTVMTVFGVPPDQRFGLNKPTYTVIGVLLILGSLVLSRSPARRGRLMVVEDLSPDIVNSSFTIRFQSRFSLRDTICVTPDSLDFVRKDSAYKPERSYPLTDVSAVTVRTETAEGEYPVPNLPGRTVQFTPGEVIVIDLPDGQLMLPTNEAQRLKRFIEERRALVG